MKGCKILLVDDDQDDLEILEEAFAKNGIEEVCLLNTAASALQYLQAAALVGQLPQLVITDLYLPGYTGIDLIKNIRSNTALWQVKVIILSAFKFEAVHQLYNTITPENYFEKPNTFQKYVSLAAQIAANIHSDKVRSARFAF